MVASLYGPAVLIPSVLVDAAMEQIEESLETHSFLWLPARCGQACTFGLDNNPRTKMTTVTRATQELSRLCDTLIRLASVYGIQADTRFRFTNIRVYKCRSEEQEGLPWIADQCNLCMMAMLGNFRTGGKCAVVDQRDSTVKTLAVHNKLILVPAAFPISIGRSSGDKIILKFYASKSSLSLVDDDMSTSILQGLRFPPLPTASLYEELCRAVDITSDVNSATIVYKSEVNDWITFAEQIHCELYRARGDGDTKHHLMGQVRDVIGLLRNYFPLEMAKRPIAEDDRVMQAPTALDFLKIMNVAKTVLEACTINEALRGAVVPVDRNARKRARSSSSSAPTVVCESPDADDGEEHV